MASVQKVKKSVENLFKEYLRDELPPGESSSSSSISSSNSSSDNHYTYLTGMTEEIYTLPAILIQCVTAIVNPVSFNWDCEVDVKIVHHYADSTRQIHNAKVAQVRDKLIVYTSDLIPILNTSTSLIDALLYTPIGCQRAVEGKKWVTTQTLTLKCNYNG